MKKNEKKAPSNSRNERGYAIVTNEAIEKRINDYCTENNLDRSLKPNILVFISNVLRRQCQMQTDEGVPIPASFWVALLGKSSYSKIKEHAMKTGIIETKVETDKGKSKVTLYSVNPKYRTITSLKLVETHLPSNGGYGKHLEDESTRVIIRNIPNFHGVINAHNSFIEEVRQTTGVALILADLKKLSKEPDVTPIEFANNVIEISKLLNGEGFVNDIDCDGKLVSSFTQLHSSLKERMLKGRNKLGIKIQMPHFVNWLLNQLLPDHHTRNPYFEQNHLFRRIFQFGKPYPNDFFDNEKLREFALQINSALLLLFERTRYEESAKEDDFFKRNGIKLKKLKKEINAVDDDLYINGDNIYLELTYKLIKMNFDWENLHGYLKLFDLFRELDPDYDYELDTIWEGTKFELLETTFEHYMSKDPRENFFTLPKTTFKNVYPNWVKLIELIKKIGGREFFINMYQLSMNLLINSIIERAKAEHDWNIVNLGHQIIIPENANPETLQQIYLEEGKKLFNSGLTIWPLKKVE